jgi:hypothetical protein
MAAEHMPAGTLRHVEQRALKVIEDTIKAGREVYEVPTWRGRVALVERWSDAYAAFVDQFNGDTLWRLAALGHITIDPAYTHLTDIRGLPTSGGHTQHRLPRDQSGRRITIPEQTGAPHA